MGTKTESKVWDAAFYDQSFQFISAMAADLVDDLAPLSGERVLDLGCGTGRLSAVIADKECEVLGIDADPTMIAAAQDQYPHIQFRCEDGAAFRVDAEFDAVFSNAALHWMTTPAPVIA